MRKKKKKNGAMWKEHFPGKEEKERLRRQS